MKQYVIDQLSEFDYKRILEYLQNNAEPSEFDVFWVALPEDLYTDTQKKHAACGPFRFAANLSMKRVQFEMLIRSPERLRCECIGYADKRQRDYVIDFADRMIEKLGIRI